MQVERGLILDIPALLLELGWTKSLSEGRRLIDAGAVTLDGAKAGHYKGIVEKSEVVLRCGKRRYVRIEGIEPDA